MVRHHAFVEMHAEPEAPGENHGRDQRVPKDVATAEDAYRCFMTTQMDWLLIDDCLFNKQEQPDWTGPSAPLVAD